MATGGNMVKLVVQLMADAKDFASELDKGTKAVQEMATEMTADLGKVSQQVAAETTKAVQEIGTGMEKAGGEMKEFATETATAMTAAVGETSTAIDEVARDVDTGMEKAAASVDELKTEATADAEAMAEGMKESTEKVTKHYIDAQGRMRDASGRFVKQGSDEWKAAMAEMGKSTDAVESKTQRMGISLVAALKKGADAAKHVRDAINRTAEDIQNMATRMGVAFTAVGTVINGGLLYAAKGAADFKMEMAGAFALLDANEQTPEAFNALTRGAQDIRMEFGLAGDEVAEAYRVAIGSGVKWADSTEFLRKSAKAARSGMVELATVTQVTAGVLAAYGLEADKVAYVQDSLAKAVNLGTVEWKDFQQGLGQVLPFAKQLGMEIHEVAGVIAVLTLRGIPAEQAMSALKAAMQGLLEPQEKNLQMFKKLGIELRDSEGKAKPFLVVLREVKKALQEKGVINLVDDKALKTATGQVAKLKDKIDNLKKDLSSARGMKEKTAIEKKLAAANKELDHANEKVNEVTNTITGKLDKDGTVAALFGDVNAKAIGIALLTDELELADQVLGSMEDSTGAIDEQFGAWSRDNPAFEMQKFAQSFQVLREVVGNAVINAFGPLLGIFRDLGKRLVELARENPKLVEGFVRVAAAAGAFFTAIGVGLLALAALAGAVAMITTIGLPALVIGFGLLAPAIAIIGGAVALIVTNFDELKAWVQANWPSIQTTLVNSAQRIWASLREVGVQVYAVLKQNGERLIAWLQSNLPAILSWIEKASKWVASVLIPAIGRFVIWFIAKVGEAFKWVADNWPSIQKRMVEGFEQARKVFTAVWDALKNLWGILKDVYAILKNTGIFDHFAKGGERAAKQVEFLATIVSMAAHNIRDLLKAIKEFVNSPSLGGFLKLAYKMATLGSLQGMLPAIIGGGGGTTTQTRGTPGGSTAQRIGLPALGGNISMRDLDGTAAAAAGANAGDTYHVTINQRTHESADEMLRRMARELNFRRGR